ncbi:MAG: L,D-transpeptidase family protein [Clostridiales bacterium]|nr:L,D-transpeptidase family protein [Candidatus Blautia equi]
MKKRTILRSLLTGFALSALVVSASGMAGAEAVTDPALPAEETVYEPLRPYVQGFFQVGAFKDPDYVWDIKTCTEKDLEPSEVQLYHPLDANQQKFYFENFALNSWRISDPQTGKALTLSADGRSVSMTAMEHPANVTATPNQTWILTENPDHTFLIQASNGKYLTRNGSHNYCGMPLSLEDASGKTNQRWELNTTWITAAPPVDTDLVNPYAPDGQYAKLNLVLKAGSQKAELTSAMLAEHMIETVDHGYVLDPDYLPAFVRTLAETFDTQDKPRKFITTAGQEITLTVGNYGYKLNCDETLTVLKNHLQTDGALAVDPVWIHKVTVLGNDNGINDLGDSYVEVDIGTQKVWLYQYGELLMESDCVTGTYGHTDTVQGAYAIFFKQAPAVLKGADYVSNVDFWMPFYNGYGIHNAGWRNTFGGEIYKTNGSHGCVNMPYDTAKQVYETVSVGYPVVVYSSIPEDAHY